MVERIFLLGLPGSGKTTVGRALASMLGWRFRDLDAEISEAAGHDIPTLFASEGEEAFRAREHEALARLARESGIVLATGGGVVERAENRELFRASGCCVTLRVSPERAWERLTAEATEAGQPNPGVARPLLAGGEPLARLRTLAARRDAWYRDADLLLDADVMPEVLAGRIVAMLVGRGLLAGVAEPIIRHVVSGAGSSVGYDAIVGWGALARLGPLLAQHGFPPRLHIVADETVASLYEAALLPGLLAAGFRPDVYRVPPGEGSKSREQLFAIYDWLAERRAERSEALLALGGGVVGDLAGLAAATYLRGLPFVQVPTSLLAQVDASIGGKVAIDHPRGKNLIGAFYPPRVVIADPATLLTLPPRQLTEGWAEVVKHGVALAADYFTWIEGHVAALLAREPSALTEAVARSVAIKAAVVEEDEREQGRRALLNYGHTIGHAIEAVTGYGTWLHGEAVAVGMMAAAHLGRIIGYTPEALVTRQEVLLTALGLPVRAPNLAIAEVLRAALWDKKASGGHLRWVLPSALGVSALVGDVPEEAVRAALRAVGMIDDVRAGDGE